MEDKVVKKVKYNISKEESERLNILKLWFVILVVFIHSYSNAGNFSNGSIVYDTPDWLNEMKYILSFIVANCAVPGFFLLSSVFLYRKEFTWKSNMKKKMRTLVIPYFIMNAFWIFFYYVVQKIPTLSVYFSNEDKIISNWGWREYLDAFTGYQSGSPMLYPLWFMRDLFVLNLLAVFFQFIVDKFPTASFLLFFLMWYCLNGTNLFFLELRAVCFWGIGCALVRKDLHIDDLDRINVLGITTLYIGSVLGTIVCNNQFGSKILYKTCILLGIVFFARCTTKMKSAKLKEIILWISSFNFAIYLFHEMNLTIIKKLGMKILPQSVIIQCLEYYFIPMITIIICIVIAYGMKRLFPNVYEIVVGKRNS